MEIAYDYYTNNIDFEGLPDLSTENNLDDKIEIKAKVNITNSINAAYDVSNKTFGFGGGNLTTYTAKVAPRTIFHEYTHAIVTEYYQISPGDNESDDGVNSRALQEAMSDIFAIIINNNYDNTNNWLSGTLSHYNQANDINDTQDDDWTGIVTTGKNHRNFANPFTSQPVNGAKIYNITDWDLGNWQDDYSAFGAA